MRGTAMSYDEDLDICSDEDCSVCAPRRAARDERRAARDAARYDAPPAPSGDGVLFVPDAVDADALLTALDGDGRVTLTRADARRVVETLRDVRSPGDATTIERLRTRVTEAQEAHRRDIATIGAALMSEAEDRDWCEIYDSVVDSLNSELSVELPTRAREVTIYLADDDGTSHFYVTVKISGGEDEGDAARQVLDAVRAYGGVVKDWGYA